MKKIFLLFCASLVILTGCSNDDSPVIPGERKDISLTTRSKELNEVVSGFTFDFFKQHNIKETQKPNFMVSPFSLSTVMAMVANGAEENTLDEIMKVLGFGGSSVNELNEYYQTFMKSLPQLDNTVDLSIANSIWTANTLNVKKNFVEVNKAKYDSEVSPVDFTAESTKKIINDWISKKTNGCISDFIKDIDRRTRMMLVNALYFKGSWASKFKKSETEKKEFTNQDGSKNKVDMMHQKGTFAYADNGTFEMLKLPYGNGAFYMKVLLPKKDLSVNDAISDLNKDMLVELDSRSHLTETDVELPKFKMEYESDLRADMEAMGMKQVFSSDANFSGMAEESIFINQIKQGIYLNVDEDGTEAATVTQTGMLGAMIGENGVFHVNRPFVFLIQEQSTGAILFIGKVASL
ncbi:MAG: serpin family protein [Phocaeicola sp.]|uniref:serpin family protein n=1 Tax=Phocaeicola TaxID=909656 RepID=UPI00234EF032|nr:serpin family protein [Phocaeicola oris]MCE2616213.1 serpin family protein [Phocaeicola oris]